MGLDIVLATRNTGKIREIKNILNDLDINLYEAADFPPFPEPAENGETFLENALLKAKAVHSATGLPALADDSGLEVDALKGAPGVRSARLGGEGLTDLDRSKKVLEALDGIPEEKRGARFRCVMALYPARRGSGESLVTEGLFYGRINFEPLGENGFGYDPIFFVPERGVTVAQMTPKEKNRISHRYRALVEMKWLLVREYGLKLK